LLTPEPSRQTVPRTAFAPGAPIFVWGVWALMLLLALAYVVRCGSNAPYFDEWEEMVPAVTGSQPLTFGWLWSQSNEHRYFLPRLVVVTLFHLGGGDFRAGMFFNALSLGALAFGMILVARRVRGGTSYADAFFPLALLHPGQGETFIMGWQAAFTLPALLTGLLLLIMARSGTQPTRRAALLAGICLALLPLCGGGGLALVPALALWLGYGGWRRWRSADPEARRTGLMLLIFALAALLLTGLNFVGYRPSGFPTSSDPRAILRTSLQFLSLSFGAAAWLWPLLRLAVPSLMLAGAAALVTAAWKQPAERFRALGLLLFLGAITCLALGLGWGRAARGWDAGFTPRYATLAVLAGCWLFLVWEIYTPPAAGRLVQMSLFALTCALLPLNVQAGLEFGDNARAFNKAFERELRAGTPPFILVEHFDHYTDKLDSPGEDKEFAGHLRMLHRAGIGYFRFLQPDPGVREVALPVAPAAVNQMTWNHSTGLSFGDNPYLLFALQKPRFVHAIRVTYSYKNTPPPTYLQLSWRRSDRNDFSEAERSARWDLHAGPEEKTVTLWVNDTIDQFRLHTVDKPGVFHLSKLTLVVPAIEAQASSRPDTDDRHDHQGG
jgi:hypothetical protein